RPPQRLVGELLERLPGPCAVAALPDAVVDLRDETVGVGQRADGLPAAVERARREMDEGRSLQPVHERSGLFPAGLVEVDAGQPAGEYPRRVGHRSAVSDEDAVRHTLTLGCRT